MKKTGIMKTTCCLALLLVVTLSASACRKEAQQPALQQPVSHENAAVPRPKIVAYGDSLTAGLGLTAGETYPAQLQKILDENGYAYEVINAGVSGDTTSDGLQRLDWTMTDDVKIVILELGANDILRGLPSDLIRKNLDGMIGKMTARGATVVLAGMEAPTNSGPEYRKEIHALYRDLADTHKLIFIPFILKGVAGSETLNQEDLSHPNAEGAKILARNVFDAIKPLLKKQ